MNKPEAFHLGIRLHEICDLNLLIQPLPSIIIITGWFIWIKLVVSYLDTIIIDCRDLRSQMSNEYDSKPVVAF